MKKNDRHEFALKNPYLTPFDFNPGVKKIVHLKHIRISSVICVDAFGEKPVWHASGAILGADGKPIELVGHVSVDDYKIMFDHIAGLLNSVGVGERWTHDAPELVLHLYKNLSENELAKIRKFKGH